MAKNKETKKMEFEKFQRLDCIFEVLVMRGTKGTLFIFRRPFILIEANSPLGPSLLILKRRNKVDIL